MMKKLFYFLSVVVSAGMLSAEQLITVPSMEEMFDQYKISIPSKTVRQYVLADRKNGVYLAKTYLERSGDYKINDFNTYKDFSAYENGEFLALEKAPTCTLYPYGIVYNYPDSTTSSFMLLQNENGVLISLTGDPGKKYVIVPSVTMGRKKENLTFELLKNDNILLITTDDEKNEMKYGAVIYDDAAYTELITSQDPSAPQDGLLSTGLFAGKYERNGSVNLIMLFDSDKDRLIAKAKSYTNKYAELETETKQFFYTMLSQCYAATENALFNKALAWSVISGSSMINSRFAGVGIYAGFPWFQQNWGRDTFISLPGISLVTGRFTEAKAVLKTFSDYQNKDSDKKMFGRIPNRVMDKSIIYNTTDGTPWMIREAYEYLQYTNDVDYAKAMYQVAKLAIEGSEKNFVDSEGFLTHDDADTWMDARISGKQPWSPRGNRAVEIQALWYNQLLVSAELAKLVGDTQSADEWTKKALAVKEAFNKKFWNAKDKMLFDRIAENNAPDKRIRPNQLMAHTVPISALLPPEEDALMVKNTISHLLFPYGIVSLDINDPYFHPYHENGMYHKDSAYHNGTIWGWNAGLAVNAMTDYGYQDFAYTFSLNLADQIVNQGCIGSMSENMDALPGNDGTVKLTGTYSQAWSVAEFARVFYQNYAGIKPELLNNKIVVDPKFAKEMGKTSVVQKIGDGSLALTFADGVYKLQLNKLGSKEIDFVFTDEDGTEKMYTFTATDGTIYTLKAANGTYFADGNSITPVKIKDSYKKLIGTLKFAPNTKKSFTTLKKQDYLKKLILSDKYKF